MFIKNIIISGFRSYREQQFPGGFSERTNAIVGKNGSGKSNFFAAIQFVLGDRFANLSPTEKKDLFHLGSGKPPLSVFVEIVFDNADGRLVIPGRSEEAEVRIRRTVGLKQDEFRVNERRFSAMEVHQLLESAGFSSSNPYNIIEQGKISALANMSEEARFQLIKDVAGTKVYENRRDESKRILQDTGAKLQQVDASIEKLDDRIKELEHDTEELKAFQSLDSQKKHIEYSIFQAELKHTKQRIDALNDEWKASLQSFNAEKDKDGSVEGKILADTRQLNELTAQIQSLENEKKTVENELSVVNGKQVIAEIDATNAATVKSHDEEECAALINEHSQLKTVLDSHIKSVAEKKMNAEYVEEDFKKLAELMTAKQRSVDSLQEKRNRASLFKNKKERDMWIASEMKQKGTTIEKLSKEIRDTNAQIADVDYEFKNVSASLQSELSDACSENELLQRENQILAVSQKRDELNQQRRASWHEIHEQECIVQRARDHADTSRQYYERTVRYDVRQGLQSLNEILAELNDINLSAKVHGPLIDLITIDQGYTAAVDATAGNALFNVIVDSFDTSATLLEQMNKRRKRGRVTFFPLDICKGKQSAIPHNADVMPLSSKIVADGKFSGVVSEVFGRTAVVANLDIGAQMVRQLQCDVVTVDGDQLSRKGGITGGYVDGRKLKLVAYQNKKYADSVYDGEKKKFDDLCQKVANIEQQITSVLNELEFLRADKVTKEQHSDGIIRQKRMLEESLDRLRVRRNDLVSNRASLASVIQETEASIEHLQRESKEDFKSKWLNTDEAQLQHARMELAQMQPNYSKAQEKVLSEATELQLQEDRVHHMQHRIGLLEDRIRELQRSQRVSSVVGHMHAAVSAEHGMLKDRLGKLDLGIETATKEKSELESSLHALNANRISASKALESKRSDLLRVESQRSLLNQSKDDLLHKLRRIGIPANALTEYSNYSISKLMTALKQANKDLSEMSHVNRKAMDQHTSVFQTRAELLSQKNHLKDELSSINALLSHLEQQKDEVIERTYKQIQFQFEEVFRELVGTDDCSAQLLLVASDAAGPNKQDYSGARMRVSFGAATGESDLHQLSGGQKSLVAIALIFAIQRCDPAPFYLFDEVDAALDSEYRSAVTRIVENQSKHCQFIFTTFKTEMLSAAEKVLAIFFHNKVTRIQAVTKEEGVALLKQAALEDRKRTREVDEEVEV